MACNPVSVVDTRIIRVGLAELSPESVSQITCRSSWATGSVSSAGILTFVEVNEFVLVGLENFLWVWDAKSRN